MNVVKTKKVDTTNAWGFGGWVGTETTYDNGVVVRKGRNVHRHTGTSSANAVLVKISEYFEVYLRRLNRGNLVPTLNGISVISVLECKGSYMAVPEDVDTCIKHGWEFKRIKTIQL